MDSSSSAHELRTVIELDGVHALLGRTLFGDVVGYRHWTFPDETEGAYVLCASVQPCATFRVI